MLPRGGSEKRVAVEDEEEEDEEVELEEEEEAWADCKEEEEEEDVEELPRLVALEQKMDRSEAQGALKKADHAPALLQGPPLLGAGNVFLRLLSRIGYSFKML